MFDRLGGSRVFSKIALQAGYWQMPIREQDIQKMALKTLWGLFEILSYAFWRHKRPSAIYAFNERCPS